MRLFTRKLSILIALILCVTIGGVYATWVYAGTGEITHTVSKGVNLTSKVEGGAAATYNVGVGDLLIQIDQAAAGDYTPVLQFNKSASAEKARLVFTLLPTDTANADIEANGIKSYVTFSSNATYEGNNIFVFATDPIVIDRVDAEGATHKWTRQDDGTFTCEIDATVLAANIQLNTEANFYLDTTDKYIAFDTALLASNINIKISDKAPTA